MFEQITGLSPLNLLLDGGIGSCCVYLRGTRADAGSYGGLCKLLRTLTERQECDERSAVHRLSHCRITQNKGRQDEKTKNLCREVRMPAEEKLKPDEVGRK